MKNEKISKEKIPSREYTGSVCARALSLNFAGRWYAFCFFYTTLFLIPRWREGRRARMTNRVLWTKKKGRRRRRRRKKKTFWRKGTECVFREWMEGLHIYRSRAASGRYSHMAGDLIVFFFFVLFSLARAARQRRRRKERTCKKKYDLLSPIPRSRWTRLLWKEQEEVARWRVLLF